MDIQRVAVGSYTFSKTFKMSDVLYIRLNNEDIKQVINIMYESYGKLISFAQKHFKKSKGKNGILKVDSFAKGDPDYDETFKKLMTEYFKDFFEADNAVLPLFEGFELKTLAQKRIVKQHHETSKLWWMISTISLREHFRFHHHCLEVTLQTQRIPLTGF